LTQIGLSGFYYLSGFDAASADLHTVDASAGDLNADRLQVRVKSPACFVVRVRDVVTKLRAFAADITSFCHIIASHQGWERVFGKNSKRY
jgi:hypothetical protein